MLSSECHLLGSSRLLIRVYTKGLKICGVLFKLRVKQAVSCPEKYFLVIGQRFGAICRHKNVNFKKGSTKYLWLVPHSKTCFGMLHVEMPVLDSEICPFILERKLVVWPIFVIAPLKTLQDRK